MRRALGHIRPSAVLVMETELWPRFFRECRRRGTPVALVNGRISEKSFGRYRLVRFFIRRVLADLTLAVMQTEEDAARIRELGVEPGRVRVAGNVKFDAEGAGEMPLTAELRERFGLGGDRPLVLAASTHAPEERAVLEAFKQLKGQEGARLLLAPRHPERFAEVASLLEASGLRWARRSSEPLESDKTRDVILLDSIGELRAAYPLAEVVFVGGSVAPVGGHNVLEPAQAARCVVTGAHTSNFTSVVGAMAERGALVQLPALSEEEAPAALADALGELLADPEARRRMGERALAVLAENRGATARTIEMLKPILQSRPGPEGRGPLKDSLLTSDL